MQFQNPDLRGLDPDWSQTATATVAALRQALDG
ncbi:MAG: copper homeostasis protein CutC, partial [Stenotrophomonas maltophilia]|nr:copper homeostasis protein CutC [Stenotrophomonas maltophilia]